MDLAYLQKHLMKKMQNMGLDSLLSQAFDVIAADVQIQQRLHWDIQNQGSKELRKNETVRNSIVDILNHAP
jgi:hypothetical protein